MKKYFSIITSVIIAALTIVSCGSNNNNIGKKSTTKNEEIAAQKEALSDSILTELGKIGDKYYEAMNGDFPSTLILTEEEKGLKPDYLLSSEEVKVLTTKSQKTAALAYLSVDRIVREAYDMPQEETDSIIAILVEELNPPFRDMDKSATPSSIIKEGYEVRKNRGEQTFFWTFQYAILVETEYILANNPELFFSKMSEEDAYSFFTRWTNVDNALKKLAKYDEDAASILKNIDKYRVESDPEDAQAKFATLEAVKKTYSEATDLIFEERADLLK